MQPAKVLPADTTDSPRILFVTEDDVGVAAAGRMLRARGYDVVHARSDDAVQHCSRQRVDLLVTHADRKVIQDVRRESGRIPVLLLERDASQVTDDVPGVAAAMYGPVRPEQLVKAVRVACPRSPRADDRDR